MGRSRVVVNTAVVGGLGREACDRMRAEAAELFERGVREGDERLLAGARSLMEQVAHAEATGPPIEEIPFTDEEEAARDAEEAEEHERAATEKTALSEAAAATERREKLARKLDDGKATAAERDEALALALRAASAS